ncbi:PurM-like, C-terminal domain [Sesbania bispinosa]|nr:PurM-like, C-terminal domain [Sesbania bispinosa]
MAAVNETGVTEFLQGTFRQNLFLVKNSRRQREVICYGANPRAVVSGGVSSSVDEHSGLVGNPTSEVFHFYRVPLIQESAASELLREAQQKISNQIVDLQTEQCFNIGLDSQLSSRKLSVLKWLLQETFEPENLATESFLEKKGKEGLRAVIVEVGPRLSFTTAWSANAVAICQACGLIEVTRLERSRRMTECVYTQNLTSFQTSVVPEEVRYIPVLERGRKALEDINLEMGLAFDDQDLEYYTKLFREDIRRNPTNVELFDIAQSNIATTLPWFSMSINHDKGHLILVQKQVQEVALGIHMQQEGDPLSRQLQLVIVLGISMPQGPGFYAPWEDQSFTYPSNLASPLQILIDSSNGASDYGNKFGEPLIQGFCRTFGMRLPSGDRREWLKPIMFSAGIGQIDHIHISKGEPDIGMLVVKIGGPAYRIGMGGGAASSKVSGQNDADLDFNAVQRGDAEMAQKLYRLVRACIEMGDKNPIISIHDQGAGGNCNVVKEIIYPKGAEIDIRAVVVGDQTMSVLEIWGAEYQEQDAILVKPESRELLQSICNRKKVSMAVIGSISGDGHVVLVDRLATQKCLSNGLPPPPPAVDLELQKVLGDMPRKSFEFHRVVYECEPLDISPGITVIDSLKRILALPSVCSKRFLTTKVDRYVTGLVAQQQTVGPLQIPLSDVAVTAQIFTYVTGGACAIGEQPIKGLLDPKAMTRLAVGEALTNLVWAKVTSLSDVKASGNWMYAAKLDGEGASMYDVAMSLSEAMIELGIAIDGGKDSLSMAAHAGGEVVKAPGNLVISVYVTCPDITKTVTPGLKLEDDGILLHIDLAKGKRRLGGSALAQAFDQVGDECPDLDDIPYLKKVFEGVQDLVTDELISAGHDISDGGLLVCALEMAFAGNRGFILDLTTHGKSLFQTLYAEELGLIVEVSKKNLGIVMDKLSGVGVMAEIIGQVTVTPSIEVKVDGLEKFQRLASCVDTEREGLKHRFEPSWKLSFTPSFTDEKYMSATIKPKVAVIREEGSNGDREMAAAFHAAGFEPWDVTMSDLLNGVISLQEFRGIVFVGGFSYADVLDSAKGWSASIRFNEHLLKQFQEFYNRPDTFSLGVCNGCQLMALLGWVPGPQVGGVLGAGEDLSQPRFIHNKSGRFECRFTNVTIKDSPAIMFKDLEDSTLGVWAAHGEGRAYFPDDSVLDRIVGSDLAPVRYCDDGGNPTETYPFNVNGSPFRIAAICSPDGRHLAMMPHPERCFLTWQFPWYPKQWDMDKKGPSPWLLMFQNAREWCS